MCSSLYLIPYISIPSNSFTLHLQFITSTNMQTITSHFQSPKRRRFLFLLFPLSILCFISFFHKFTSHTPTLSLFPKHPPSHFHIHKRILQTQTAVLHCDGSLYHDLCVSTLTRVVSDLTSTTLPDIISATVNETISDVRSTDFNVTNIRQKLPHLTILEIRALEDCHTLFLETVSELKTVVSDLSKSPAKKYDDLRTMLSAAMTNQATCLDGFEGSKNQVSFLRRQRYK